MAEVSDVLMSVLSTVRVPRPGDRVHKDECAFSFASPVSALLLLLFLYTVYGLSDLSAPFLSSLCARVC